MIHLNSSLPIAPVVQDSEAIAAQVSPILFGGLILILILTNHAFFTEIASLIHNRVTVPLLEKQMRWRARPVFYLTLGVLLISHLVEIGIWGYALVFANLAKNLDAAIYFSGSTYTTLGYGQDIMPDAWNSITTVIALSGMFSIAWTTSLLMSMIGAFRVVKSRRHSSESLDSHDQH